MPGATQQDRPVAELNAACAKCSSCHGAGPLSCKWERRRRGGNGAVTVHLL